MSEVTTFLRATAVLSAGLKDGDTVSLYPFFKVDLHEGLKCRRVFVNYTFGETAGDGSPPQFEGPMGEAKLRLFHCLKTNTGGVIVLVITANTKEKLRERILQHLWGAPAESRLLFVFPRHLTEDPFYDALGLVVKGQQQHHDAAYLDELGLKVDPPFIAFTKEELSGDL